MRSYQKRRVHSTEVSLTLSVECYDCTCSNAVTLMVEKARAPNFLLSEITENSNYHEIEILNQTNGNQLLRLKYGS